MSEVSVIGLGEMGQVLARTLLESGRGVTVWNRTGSKAEPLARRGAKVAASVSEAIRASPVTIICVTDYEAARGILDEEAARAVRGKALVQLTTGTPEEAREGASWAREHGADYLDGAIAATPSQVGRADTAIFVSGSAEAFGRAEGLLQVLAGGLSFMGEAPGAASAWDMAMLSHLFGGLLGFYHGALICEAENIGVDELGLAMEAVAPVMGEIVRHDGEAIHKGDFQNPEASLEICWRSLELISKQARESGLSTEFPAFAASLFKKGMDARLGGEKASALIKVLRASA